MNRPTLAKAAIAILPAAAIVLGALQFLEGRLVALAVYAVLFTTLAYFVIIFRGHSRDIALTCASITLALFIAEAVAHQASGRAVTYKEKYIW